MDTRGRNREIYEVANHCGNPWQNKGKHLSYTDISRKPSPIFILLQLTKSYAFPDYIGRKPYLKPGSH